MSVANLPASVMTPTVHPALMVFVGGSANVTALGADAVVKIAPASVANSWIDTAPVGVADSRLIT